MGFTFSGMAQSLRGTVTDNTGETLPMANVVVKSGESIVRGTTANFDGEYVVSPLDPGTYTVEVSFVGYTKQIRREVVISPSKATFIDVELSEGSNQLQAVELVEKPPIIDKEKVGANITSEAIKSAPVTTLTGLIATAPGIASTDPSRSQTVRGGRDDQTAYIVDGVRMIGSTNVPLSGTDQIQVITGGVPAEFGDLTSGLITITTKGPSSNTFGGLDLQTSNFLDAYDYSLGEFYFSTPLLWKDKEKKANPIVGLFVSGRGSLLKDANYAPFNTVLKESSRQKFLDNPISFTRTIDEDAVTIVGENNLNYYTKDDFEEIDYYDNNNSRTFSLQGKFNVKTSETSNLKVGGTFSNSYRKIGIGEDANSTARLFNSKQGRTRHDNVTRLYADYKQFFAGDEEGEGIQRAYYQLHVDYSNQNRRRGSDGHGGDYWKNGHVGTFTPTYRTDGNENFGAGERITFYNNLTGEEETVTTTGASQNSGPNYTYNFNYNVGHYDFDASKFNPERAIYTNSYYDYATDGEERNLSDIASSGGLINGGNPGYIYSLWDAPATAYMSGSKYNRQQFRITGAAGGEIKNHNIKVGFEFQQRTVRFWGINAGNLWSAARSLENQHLERASSYRYEFDGIVNANNSLVLTAIPEFDESRVLGYAANIREQVGASLYDPIATDSYQPDALSVDLFSNEEMLNNVFATYYGYDAHGNPLTGVQPDVNDFLTDSLDNGLLKREIGAFKPIYMAGYIQDKFIVNDLVFNIGVRVDRYDANQEVLKDKYSIYNMRSAGEVDFSAFGDYELPSQIGSDYAVYVDNLDDPTTIAGFRDGDIWYNAEGIQISDPQSIGGSSGKPEPYLHENANNGLSKNNNFTANGFADYDPQINVMPRISFNFPVSDEVMFYAYYNILTQRPTESRTSLDPSNYLDMALGRRAAQFINNPNLKPQQTTDYELGFKQALSESSALELSLFYREMKDMIQVAKVSYAYPQDYTHFDNKDFGTVKGLTLNYEMRGDKNLTFNVNYTLQYAEGTGSGDRSALNLVNFGQPDLRTTLPLSFDSRHQFGASAVYGFGKGKGYRGPENLKKFFDGFSISLQGNANSGTPYTKQRYAESQVISGLNSANSVNGSVYGSRLPFNYRFDLKLTKNFEIAFKKSKEEGKPAKKNPMSIYLQVNNLLNTTNTLEVYGYTGNSNDDGFLNSAEGISALTNKLDADTYQLLYGYQVNDPFSLSRPRTIRLGVTLGF
ncbi:MAG: carboxypeptidase regulatory-like domain-containing protein [Flavobacteriales bacterium]